MSKAIYAFSGDPPTFGHLNIVKRVAKTFDEVVVGIGVNPGKKYMFSLEERKQMSKQMFEGIPNVTVVSFEGLLVNYAFENSIPNIIRGIRNTQDMEYEGIVEMVGASQNLEIEVYYLFADVKLAHISSSAVKALQKESGFIHDYVPLHVKQALEIRMSKRYMLGVTGTIGAGKSHTCRLIKKWCGDYGVPCTYIDLDEIARQTLNELTEPVYVELRKEISSQFPGGLVDALRKASGLVLVESALFVEAGILRICNNNVLLVNVSDKDQQQRLKERRYDKEQIRRRIESQYNEQKKLDIINEERERHNHGSIHQCVSSGGLNMKSVLGALGYPIEKIVSDNRFL